MGRDADKPRGRMSTYAFFVQTCRSEHKKKHPNESVGFAEFSKKCAERWKTMSDQEKSRFHQMADKDKKRYDNEMSTYKPPKGEKGKKRKRTKDPDTPKRSLSAFFWFCNDERPKVKETMPDSTFGEVAKELGRRWNDVTDETKSRNEALAAKDKARYEKEMKLFKGKKGKPSPSAKVVAPPPMEKEEYEEEEEDEEVEEVEEEVEGEEEEEEEDDE